MTSQTAPAKDTCGHGGAYIQLEGALYCERCFARAWQEFLHRGHPDQPPAVPLVMNRLVTTEQAAAEVLQYLPTGRYISLAVQNLRRALGAGYWRSNGEYVHPGRWHPVEWSVPAWAWDDRPEHE